MESLVKKYPDLEGEVRGRGLMKGVACGKKGLAGNVCRMAFKKGLIMETSGPGDEVFKIMPPLTIEEDLLKQGFVIIEESVKESLAEFEKEPV